MTPEDPSSIERIADHRPGGVREVERLRHRQELLEAQLEAAPDGLLVVDARGGTVAYNRRLLELWRIPAALVARVDGPPLLDALAELVGAPDSFAAATRRLGEPGGAPFRDELHLRDGRVFERYGAQLVDREGGLLGWLWSFADVSDRRADEEHILYQGQITRTITDNAKGSLFMVDDIGRATFMNPAAVQLTGHTLASIGDRELHEVLHGGAHPGGPAPDCPVATAFHGASMRDYEVVFFRRDGTSFPASCTVAPLVRDGRTVGAVVDFQDITERKRAEQVLTEADRRKNEFLAMLAHELRNPLGPILHAAEIFERAAPDDPILREASDAIQRQVTHVARLVDDLLDVSRITRGKILLHSERLDLVPLAQTTAEDLRPTIEDGGLSFAVALPDEPIPVVGDPTRLAQVIGNLLSNAGKFTDAPGRVELELRRRRGEAVISVRDTGIGIDPELRTRLFEPFSQADSSLARTGGGLGLGLAVVKGLVELHDGRVEVQTPRSGGSIFSVYLPLASEQDDGVTASPARPAMARGRRVLVIEDSRAAGQLIRLALRMLGHDVLVAFRGPEGLELARRARPELVLCDIGLPGGLDGYAVARAFRADPELATTRLVALTGYGRAEDQERAIDAGFDDHLTKPVSIAKIERLLLELPDAEDAEH